MGFKPSGTVVAELHPPTFSNIRTISPYPRAFASVRGVFPWRSASRVLAPAANSARSTS